MQRTTGAKTALMQAVDCGHLDCVKEMDKLDGTDFETKINKGVRYHHNKESYHYFAIYLGQKQLQPGRKKYG